MYVYRTVFAKFNVVFQIKETMSNFHPLEVVGRGSETQVISVSVLWVNSDPTW